MIPKNIINVHIGQIRLGKDDLILKSILGSCVGIALLWKDRGICGLAHCLLPEAPRHSYEISGVHVSQAVPSLLAMMKISNKDIPSVEAVIAGGGKMTNVLDRSNSGSIGQANASMAVTLLDKTGIRIIHQDTGGEEGRRIVIDCMNFSYQISKIPRLVTSRGTL